MKNLYLILLIILATSCTNSVKDKRTINFPKQEIKVLNHIKKENIWVYIMAG